LDQQKRVLALSERMIAFPHSISAEARAALEQLVADDGTPVHARHAMPAHDDHAAWTGMRAAVDAQYAEAMRGRAGTVGSTIMTMQVEQAIVHVATPDVPFDPDHALIDLHGGAFVFGGGEACKVGASRQAEQHAVRCYGVDYRMPPEHPFPAALNDCLAVYRLAVQRHGPSRISVIGRSAGGNLAAALLLRARAEGLPMPASLVLLSPEVDLTESGDSVQTNQLIDVVLPRPLMASNLLYANGRALAEPYLSPLFGDLHGFPPTFLQSGTRDLFLSNTVRMHRALLRAAVAAELHVFEAMPHGGFSGSTPEDRELDAEVRRFVRAHWA